MPLFFSVDEPDSGSVICSDYIMLNVKKLYWCLIETYQFNGLVQVRLWYQSEVFHYTMKSLFLWQSYHLVITILQNLIHYSTKLIRVIRMCMAVTLFPYLKLHIAILCEACGTEWWEIPVDVFYFWAKNEYKNHRESHLTKTFHSSYWPSQYNRRNLTTAVFTWEETPSMIRVQSTAARELDTTANKTALGHNFSKFRVVLQFQLDYEKYLQFLSIP